MNVSERWLRLGKQVPTTLLELAVCLCIFVAMTAVAVHSMGRAQQHLHVLDAVFLMSSSEIAMMETHAVTGEWPPSSEPPQQMMHGSRLGVTAMRGGGAIDYAFPDRTGDISGRILTFRAWQGPGAGETPVAWLCGHAGAKFCVLSATSTSTLRARGRRLSEATARG